MTEPTTAPARREHEAELADPAPPAGRPSRRGLVARRATATLGDRNRTDGRRDRRSILRYGRGVALSVLAAGAASVLNVRPASAQVRTCCALAAPSTPWCNHYCADADGRLSLWGCNNMECLCFECFVGVSTPDPGCYGAFSWIIGCSNHTGCCSR